MKKSFLIGSTLALSLFASSLGIYASTNEPVPQGKMNIKTPELRDVIHIDNDLNMNTSYIKIFTTTQSNGENINIYFDNYKAGTVKVWVKIKRNGSYVYSKFLEPGQTTLYTSSISKTNKYEVTIDTTTGARMNTLIKARQF